MLIEPMPALRSGVSVAAPEPAILRLPDVEDEPGDCADEPAPAIDTAPDAVEAPGDCVLAPVPPMTLPTVPSAVDAFDRCASAADPDTANEPDAALLFACWLDAPVVPTIVAEPEADDALAAWVDAAAPLVEAVAAPAELFAA